MRPVTLIIFIFLVLINKKTNAQLVAVFKSDTLNIYTNKNGENVKPKVCLLKFGAVFNDSVVVYLNKKRIFSKFLKPSNYPTTEVDLTAPYISLPLKNKQAELKICLLNEKIIVKTQLITGYRYLYVSKHLRMISLSYQNKEDLYY